MALCPWDHRQDAPPQGFIPVLPILLLPHSFGGKGYQDQLPWETPAPSSTVVWECNELFDTED